MNATFVKYCSLCTFENLAIASFCEKCDADLMNVPVEMRREEITAAAPPLRLVAPAVETLDTLFSENLPRNNQLATHDQSEVVTQRAETLSNITIELALVANPSIKFSIRAGQTVGRASKADVVLSGIPDLEYISRAHARFIQRRAQWYVQYIAEGNSITVDGVESRDDAEIAIYDQSVVVLSFTAFTVKLP